MSLITDLVEQESIGLLLGAGSSAALAKFAGTYERDAIILFGGIVGASYTSSLVISAFSGNMTLNFRSLAGGSLLSAQPAMYPFANQQIAANALIQQPLRISMMAYQPADENVGYTSKSAAFTSLMQSLNRHNNLGGLYSVVTPAYTYTNCLLLDVVDISDGRSNQVQDKWRFDFLQPLITLQQAQAAQSTLMQALAQGTPIIGTPSWSGVGSGSPPGLPYSQGGGLIAPSASQ